MCCQAALSDGRRGFFTACETGYSRVFPGVTNITTSTLSGGEQQRVILARALAQQTPCLILDEPTNHLDIKFQLQLMDLVRGLNRTVIAAIHDLNIAALYCDRLCALKDGKIIGEGTPRELLTPEFIRKVYEVDAQVMTGEDGAIHILYHAQGKERTIH